MTCTKQGDFWHSRGALPVEPLNRVLAELRSWGDAVPTLMLVGNHDQTALGGEVHSLEVLASVRPASLHVFARPTVFRGALWLPYRRSAEELQRAIQLATGDAHSASLNDPAGAREPVRAIFCHADIKGARINDTYQASLGVGPELFPAALPVYSGHYHEPHMLPGTAITYLGSPYQVSRAEAGQQKRLLILEPDTWAVRASLPINIGPRHVTLRGAPAQQFLSQSHSALQPSPRPESRTPSAALSTLLRPVHDDIGVSSELPFSSPLASEHRPFVPGGLRMGDRVRVVVEGGAAPEEREAVERLRSAGVDVELVLPPKAAKPRLEVRPGPADGHVEGADAPAAVFQRYCEMRGLSPAALQEGLAILSEISQQPQGSAASDRRSSSGAAASAGPGSTLAGSGGADLGLLLGLGLGRQGRTVSLERLLIKGFGPFRDAVDYPLDGGGLRVVTGENMDDPGAESNGSGKSCLVMAPLWAIKGDGEGDLAGKLTRADVVHDAAKEARVTLEGSVNGRPFLIERATTRTALKSLRFVLDGQDLTCLDSRQTQELIDEALRADLIEAASFKSQSSVVALLDATDKELKEQIGSVVGLEVWERARDEASARLRAVRSQREKLASAVAYVLQEVGGLRDRHGKARDASDQFQAAQQLRLQQAQRQARGSARTLARQHDGLLAARAHLAAFFGPAKLDRGAWDALVAAAEQSTGPDSYILSTLRPAPGRSESELEAELKRLEAQRAGVQAEIRCLEDELLSLQATVAEHMSVIRRETSEAGAAQGRLDAAREKLASYRKLRDASASAASTCNSHTGAIPVSNPDPEAPATPAELVCDRCLQPVSSDAFARSLQQLQDEAAAIERSAARAHASLQEAEGRGRQAGERLQSAQTRRRELDGRDRSLQQLTSELSAVLLQMRARASVHREEAARQRVLQRELLDRAAQAARAALGSSWALENETGAYLAELERRGLLEDSDDGADGMMAPTEGPPGDHGTAAADPPVSAQDVAQDLGLGGLAAEFDRRRLAVQSLADSLTLLQQRVDFALQHLAGVVGERDPSEAAAEALGSLLAERIAALSAAQSSLAGAEARVEPLAETEKALGRGGIQGFILESAVLELQDRANYYLEALTGCFHLELRPFKAKGGGSASTATGPGPIGDVRRGGRGKGKAAASETAGTAAQPEEVVERIEKVIYVQHPDGRRFERTLRQCSGGERRRVALALTLGFRDLVADRAGVRSSLLVLDEVMQLLDGQGTRAVCDVLRSAMAGGGAGVSSMEPTVLLVAQAGSIPVRQFPTVDVVSKRGGASAVEIGVGRGI